MRLSSFIIGLNQQFCQSLFLIFGDTDNWWKLFLYNNNSSNVKIVWLFLSGRKRFKEIYPEKVLIKTVMDFPFVDNLTGLTFWAPPLALQERTSAHGQICNAFRTKSRCAATTFLPSFAFVIQTYYPLQKRGLKALQFHQSFHRSPMSDEEQLAIHRIA